MILFLHWAGWAVWLGAQLTFMVWGPVARRLPLESWAYTWDTLSRIQRWIIGPAAAVATLTGIVLSMQYAQRETQMTTGLIIMQSGGLVAGILTLALVTPWVNRMAFLAAKSLETGQLDPRAEALRRRIAFVGSLSGLLILVSLFAVVQP